MVEPKSKFTQALIGSEILCPLCEDETVEVDETRKGTAMFYCRTQRSPVFANHPRELPDRVLPNELTQDNQDETELEQESDPEENPWRKGSSDSEDESDGLDQDPAGWCPWCGDPIMPAEISENSDGEMEADHDFKDCDEMEFGYKKTYVYEEMLNEPPEDIEKEDSDSEETKSAWRE